MPQRTAYKNSKDVPRSKYLDLAQYLLDAEFDPRAKASARRSGRMCRSYTVCGHASRGIVECYLEHGAVVEGSNGMRLVPPGFALHTAVAEKKENVVRWLLGHGAEVGMRNGEGKDAKDYLGESKAGAILGFMEEGRT